MSSTRIERPMSDAQFLAWAERQEGRYELVEGTAMMQAGATRDHERVAKRIFALLYASVDEGMFDVNKGDFGVRIRPGAGKGTILYPDVVVDLQSGRGDEQATMSPIVVIEVLSRSTDFGDHVDKLKSYMRRDKLRQYIVFAQKEPRAWSWASADGRWPSEPCLLEGCDGILALPTIEATLRLGDIYRPAAASLSRRDV